MGTIKGQNLRLFIENECVAAATSCMVHCALNVQESDTKDDIDNWIVQEPVGHSWDAQVDAMVIDAEQSHFGGVPGAIVESGNIPCNDEHGEIHYAPQLIHLQRGQWLKAQMANGSRRDFTIYAEDFTSLATTGEVAPSIYYEATMERDVYIGLDAGGDNYVIYYEVVDPAISAPMLANYIKNGSIVDVVVATTYPNSNQNRDQDGQFELAGQAIVSDLTINAPNQDIVTYSCKLTGTGSLSIVE